MPRARLRVNVSAGARQSSLVVIEDGTIRIRVRARAVDGKANEAVQRFLSEHLDVPLSSISIKHGATSRLKLVGVAGLTLDQARSRLASRGSSQPAEVDSDP